MVVIFEDVQIQKSILQLFERQSNWTLSSATCFLWILTRIPNLKELQNETEWDMLFQLVFSKPVVNGSDRCLWIEQELLGPIRQHYPYLLGDVYGTL